MAHRGGTRGRRGSRNGGFQGFQDPPFFEGSLFDFNSLLGQGDPFGSSSSPFGGDIFGSSSSPFGGNPYGLAFGASASANRHAHSQRATKAPAIETKLLCSLEELYKGTTKNMKISREIIDDSGRIVLVEEILTIDVKPGWKKGTKITFMEKGNEAPNVIPADIVFVIDEKPHPEFTRDGNDLVMTHKIPLAMALTGCDRVCSSPNNARRAQPHGPDQQVRHPPGVRRGVARGGHADPQGSIEEGKSKDQI